MSKKRRSAADVYQIHNDEPAGIDLLNRDRYANAFANVAMTCDTPLVVGIYGTWGSGKSTLMQLIRSRLDPEKTISFWFDPWMHQFDENPVLALLHTVAAESNFNKSKKLLTTIAAAIGSSLLKVTTSVSVADITELAEKYEEEQFKIREAQVRLKEYFYQLIEALRGNGERRIVFFIDDLDRCMPPQILSLLESLKLYLNIPGCIYFLGVDHDAIERSIAYHYKDTDLSENKYLDKIVQLPFSIPPVFNESLANFVTPLLSKDLQCCKKILVNGLSKNPRNIKRFINTLSLNHELAKQSQIENYNPTTLASILLIQHRNKALFDLITVSPRALIGYIAIQGEDEHSFDEHLAGDHSLQQLVKDISIADETALDQYLYLTRLLAVPESDGEANRTIDLDSVLSRHESWVNSAEKEGARARFAGIDLSKLDISNRNLSKSTFERADLKASNLSNCNLSGANFRYAQMYRCVMNDSLLENADLSDANFEGAELKGCALVGARLSKTNFVRANLNRSEVMNCDARQSSFKNAILQRVSFDETDLTGSNFAGADLDGVSFERCRLERVNLTHCTLAGLDLSNLILNDAILFGADFSASTISGSDLSRANLEGANLTNADMDGSILFAANLARCKGLKLDQLKRAHTDENTVLPSEFARELGTEFE